MKTASSTDLELPAALPDDWSLVIADGGDAFDKAARLEYEIFLAEGFCAPSPRGIVEEYESWAADSAFHAVLDADQRVLGVVRTIFGNLDALPVGALAATSSPAPDPVLEYASLAVAPDARKAGVAEALYRSVWRHAKALGAKGLVAIVEPWLLDLLRDHYGFAFRAFGPTVWYMGGHVVPIGVDLVTLERELAARRPHLWAWVYGCSSVDGVDGTDHIGDIGGADGPAPAGEARS